MKRIVGVYQSGMGDFIDKQTGRKVEYDTIVLWYETDEIPGNLAEKFAGLLTYKEKFKRSDVRLLNHTSDDYFELVGREVEFLYGKDKDGNLKINGVFVQNTPIDNKSNTKKES